MGMGGRQQVRLREEVNNRAFAWKLQREWIEDALGPGRRTQDGPARRERSLAVAEAVMATMEGESTDGTLHPWEEAVMLFRARRFDGLDEKKTSQLERKRASKEREAQQEKDEEE